MFTGMVTRWRKAGQTRLRAVGQHPRERFPRTLPWRQVELLTRALPRPRRVGRATQSSVSDAADSGPARECHRSTRERAPRGLGSASEHRVPRHRSDAARIGSMRFDERGLSVGHRAVQADPRHGVTRGSKSFSP